MSDDSRPKKINISPLPEQTTDYSHYEESNIRWDRIAMAAAIILAVAYGIYSLISTDDPAGNQTATTNSSKIESSKIESSKPEPSQTEPSLVEPQEVPTKTDEPSKLEEKNTDDADAGLNESSTVSTEVTKQSEPSVTDEPIEPDVQSLEQTKAQSQAQPETEPAQSDLHRQTESLTTNQAVDVEAETVNTAIDSPITIHHPGMTQVQLTSMLKNKTPVDQLGSVINMNAEGIIKVVLFTEMSNLRGTRTRHEWYRNNIKQATIKVPVNANPQSSSSSKFINAQMLGDWQVKVLDDQNTLLAEAKFHVSSHQ